MIYADYNFYTAGYLGNKIPEKDFNFYAMRASEELDSRTFGRIGEVTPVIRKACCAVAEVLYSDSVSRGKSERGIASEKVGNYSVSYSGSSSETDKIVSRRIKSEIEKYLGNTGLLYRGV